GWSKRAWAVSSPDGAATFCLRLAASSHRARWTRQQNLIEPVTELRLAGPEGLCERASHRPRSCSRLRLWCPGKRGMHARSDAKAPSVNPLAKKLAARVREAISRG